LEGGGSSVRRDGCVLFADVAGFTPLTEGLARIGKEGAEELVRILNAFFEAMIGIAHEEGGDVLRFGGDAMTLFFPGGTASGLRAAVRMQAESRRFVAIETRGGTFPLAMKVGVSTGSVLLGIVGDDVVGRDYFAAGTALDLSAEAEHHAEKGMVAFCPRCVAELSGKLQGLEILDDGFGLLREPLKVVVKTTGGSRPGLTMPGEDVLAAFLPAFIREKAAIPEGLQVAEHRRTTTLFLTFKGLDYEGDPEVAGKVDGAFREIAGAVRRYGGTVNKVDMGDKGSKALCLFGTPTALEGQEEMGCRAAMEILESKTLRGFLNDLKIGVTTAPVFAAYVGCDERREYTVMGDGINLAARLMSNSFAWKMLASKEVFEQASDALDFRALDPIFVKGKAEKVPIYRPEGEKDRAGGSGKARFVGREEILQPLLSRMGEIERPCGFLLSGEAGVGKSALLGMVRQGLDRRGVRYTLVPLASYSSTTYMSAWRLILFSCLGVARTDTPEIRSEALRAAVPPEDIEYLPLLNTLMDLDLPETSATQVLAAKDRKDMSFAILARLIAGQARETPYAVLLDHLESADPASLEFLQVLAAEGAGIPLKVLCTVRADTPKAVLEAVASLEPLALPPFSAAEIRQYFVRIVGVAVPPESLLDFAQKRTHGNPKFLEQVVAALRREGVLCSDASGALGVDEERLASTSFPDTLEGLLLSRVDILPEAERQLLKSASVLGTSFSMGLLGAVLGEDPKAVIERVRTLEGTGLIRMDNWGTRPYATFNDTLLRDALYESLNFASKRQLHRRVGDFLESDRGSESALWPVLARHFDAAGDTSKAADYYWKAAQEARSRYDNFSAFALYDRFVVLREAAGADPGNDDTFRQALLHLGEAYKNLGRLEEADAYCQKILDGTKRLFHERVTALRRIADNHRLRGDIKMSLDLFRLAMLQARKLGDSLQEAWIQVDSSAPLAMSGRFPEAVLQLQQAERIAKKIKAYDVLVYALMNQGMCLYHGQGDYAGAVEFYKRARATAIRHSLKPNLVAITVNLAQALFDLGEYRKALEMAMEAMNVAKQFGYRHFLLPCLSNVALYQTVLGLWEEGLRTSNIALTTAKHHGMQYSVAANLHTMGFLLAQSSDYGRALQNQTSALRTYLEVQRSGEAIACLSEIVGIANQLNNTEIARAALDRFYENLREEADHEARASSLGFQAQWTLHQVRMGCCRPEEATGRFAAITEKARAMGLWWLTAEVAEAQLTMWLSVGLPAEAVRASEGEYEGLVKRYSPLKVAPYLLSFSEALFRAGDFRRLKGVISNLRRYERCFDRGLPGIRYNALMASLAWKQKSVKAARARRIKAVQIVYLVSSYLAPGQERTAFFAHPTVREVLRGDEPA
jgi:class 3 adenylate cyclase/tetratricopeptide (TPR) repeat protein